MQGLDAPRGQAERAGLSGSNSAFVRLQPDDLTVATVAADLENQLPHACVRRSVVAGGHCGRIGLNHHCSPANGEGRVTVREAVLPRAGGEGAKSSSPFSLPLSWGQKWGIEFGSDRRRLAKTAVYLCRFCRLSESGIGEGRAASSDGGASRPRMSRKCPRGNRRRGSVAAGTLAVDVRPQVVSGEDITGKAFGAGRGLADKIAGIFCPPRPGSIL